MSSTNGKDQYKNELRKQDSDKYLNETGKRVTCRLQSSKTTTSQTKKITDRSATSVIDDISSILGDSSSESESESRPTTASKKKTLTHREIFHQQLKIESSFLGSKFFEQPKFCHSLKSEMARKYSVETNISKVKYILNLQYPSYIIEFQSENERNNVRALESLQALLEAVDTKLVEYNSGLSENYPDCTKLIRMHGEQYTDLHILFSHETIGILIIYFNKFKSTKLHNLCISNVNLDAFINEFVYLYISLPAVSDLTTTNKSNLAQKILKLEHQVQSQNIVIILKQRCIHLFGLINVVNEVEKEIKSIINECKSTTFNLSLEPEQIEFLLDIYLDELKVLETNFYGTNIIESLRKGELIAPSYLHDRIEEEIMSLARLCTPISYEIQEKAFGLIALSEDANLKNIARQYKSQIKIHGETTSDTYKIPKALAQDVSNKLTAAAITIYQSDLAEAKVDLVVVSSTSEHLCKGILKKGGESVKKEYHTAVKSSSSGPFEIDSGNLQCRKLLFLTWKINQTSDEAFYQSIRNFVSTAVQHAIKFHHTSIAFPSIGCGGYNFDKTVVAHEMLTEAQRQLISANVLLKINFIILPNETDVFGIFQSKLESLQAGRGTTRQDDHITYNFTTLTITIISNTIEKQEECRMALEDYVQKSISVSEQHDLSGLKKWTQPTIDSFYMYCFQRLVIPEMDIHTGYCKLFGSKESVREAENEYYRQQTTQSEHARLMVVARDVIWAFKKDENDWEKFPSELNASIEDAFISKLKTFKYTNDKSVEYEIDFKNYHETCVTTQQQRDIIRHGDFRVPPHWDLQIKTVQRFFLDENSHEYKDIRELFDKTMAKKYTTIIRIERIQNKQWYTQYNSYKNFSGREDTEKKLFHGCLQESVSLIVNSFFNRSFAGVNGVVYGQGAYFSANAVYSHGYATPNQSNGERSMFVVNVIVGKTTRGNRSMKTPPAGFDSTTDDDHIFVTYRDDQAYAEYLIVYH
ncbi:unnamed protein product [Rotaria socialis]|uniref:Poly [ADP-ribose] polymerase n=1 Tax=Rotaria socialis TaxID=392032 RepID=A0A821TC42_9BILA|nr:unnamed protein product [Rotaria socialis]CAF3465024.1 unnamed protein product [Rotaria socialis]CAF4492715.1 unnamed protein product [Rotaria socialis]CAF4871878.1 unnamed protein product [Rotaria socialis]